MRIPLSASALRAPRYAHELHSNGGFRKHGYAALENFPAKWISSHHTVNSILRHKGHSWPLGFARHQASDLWRRKSNHNVDPQVKLSKTWENQTKKTLKKYPTGDQQGLRFAQILVSPSWHDRNEGWTAPGGIRLQAGAVDTLLFWLVWNKGATFVLHLAWQVES